MIDTLIIGNTNAIAATATAQARALPASSPSPHVAVFYNQGPYDAFVCLGASSVVATLPALSTNAGAEGNATPIPVGSSLPLRCVTRGVSGETTLNYWSVICQSGNTASVFCTTGEGL